jgi:hypothetical protein
VDACPAGLTVALVSTAAGVAESIRRCSSLPLRVALLNQGMKKMSLKSRSFVDTGFYDWHILPFIP